MVYCVLTYNEPVLYHVAMCGCRFFRVKQLYNRALNSYAILHDDSTRDYMKLTSYSRGHPPTRGDYNF